MIKLLEYPFDNALILRKRKAIRKELLQRTYTREIRVAVLGGSTTNELVNIIDLFLLKKGFLPSFYQSEYNKYYEDAVFGSGELSEFNPSIIYIHTTHINVSQYPAFQANADEVETVFENELFKFQTIWKSLKKYNCPIIQNNFDLPVNRSLGNLDSYDIHGKTYFLNRLNLEFSKEAQLNSSLFINDINYLSASIGLKNWFDKNIWFTAKYAISFDAIPTLSNNIVNIISAIFGLTKKCLVLDLDNTCWGGIIGDDGLNGIRLGNESASGEAYMAFQNYAKELKHRGVLLAVCSKNEHDIAKEGFTHSDSVLAFEDFKSFKANWNPKHKNIESIADEINIGLDSLVFIDDNAVERNIVESQLPDVSVPDVGNDVLNFIEYIEQNGYFETGSLSKDDINRNKFYSENQERAKELSVFENYQDFLTSLAMEAEIKPFSDVYIDRITQLINKTNQFNLTTKRYTVTEVEAIAAIDNFIPLYGKLVDKFGDNGLIAISIGKVTGDKCIIDTFLMSCRVLKRDMEFAMLDLLVEECKKRDVIEILGTYIRTPKNNMVANLYAEFGFELLDGGNDEVTNWRLALKDYNKKDITIKIN